MVGVQSNLNGAGNPSRGPRLSIGADSESTLVGGLFVVRKRAIILSHRRSWYADSWIFGQALLSHG